MTGSPSSGMDEPRSVKFLGLLRVLLHHEVDFLVVGGVAARDKDRAALPVLRQTLAMKTSPSHDKAT